MYDCALQFTRKHTLNNVISACPEFRPVSANADTNSSDVITILKSIAAGSVYNRTGLFETTATWTQPRQGRAVCCHDSADLNIWIIYLQTISVQVASSKLKLKNKKCMAALETFMKNKQKFVTACQQQTWFLNCVNSSWRKKRCSNLFLMSTMYEVQHLKMYLRKVFLLNLNKQKCFRSLLLFYFKSI